MEVTPDFWIMPISRGLINKGFPARWRHQTNRILSFVPEREARGIWQYFTELEVT